MLVASRPFASAWAEIWPNDVDAGDQGLQFEYSIICHFAEPEQGIVALRLEIPEGFAGVAIEGVRIEDEPLLRSHTEPGTGEYTTFLDGETLEVRFGSALATGSQRLVVTLRADVPHEEGTGVFSCTAVGRETDQEVAAGDANGNPEDANDVAVRVHRARLGLGCPNPFGERTTIQFHIARPGRVRFEIFDVRGRRIRVLLDQALQPGGHEVTWDGRDDRGFPCGSGLYLYRLTSPGFVRTGRSSLVR